MSKPLSGIRVLELGQFIAGPFAGLQLADLGAEVIKVERPGIGDPFRQFGVGDTARGYSHNFCAFNRNKRSLSLDVTSPAGRATFRRLAARADVVLENFRPGVMARLGLDSASLRAAAPQLIYCSIAGFAGDGPYRERPAYDAVGQAVSGLLSLLVDPADPRVLGPTISDQMTGMQASTGILGALFERSRTGQGAHVEVTMVEATMSLIPDFFTAYTQAGIVMGPESRSAVSLSFAFECADERLVAIHVSSIEKFWIALLSAVERGDLNTDPRFCDRRSRVRNYRALVEELRPVFARRSSAEWIERLAAADVPAAGVNSVPEAMKDPEVEHLQLFHRMSHPQYGEQTMMHRSVRIDGAREIDPAWPPALGEHTDLVLRDFGFTDEEVAVLRADKVV